MKVLTTFLLCLIATVNGQDKVQCEEPGFHRHPDDCAKFYRCVDFGYRALSIFHFDCPSGTVFDENLSVCNWPWAAQPPCPEPEEEEEQEEEEEEQEEEDEDTVIVSPTFSFECDEAGIFPHENDCKKFWLCKAKDEEIQPAELYRCPAGFLFHDEIRRCQKEDKVECDKTPDLSRSRFEPPAITLTVSELQDFFARWA